VDLQLLDECRQIVLVRPQSKDDGKEDAMASATIRSKGQVRIPEEVRARKVHASSLAGLLHRKGQRRLSLEEMDAAIAEGSGRTQPG